MLQPLAIRRDAEAMPEISGTVAELRRLLEQAVPRRFPVKAGEGWVFLDLRKVTHFEVSREVVHVWAGQCLRTSWTTLTQVEAAFPGEAFLRIQRHLLIRPEAVSGFRMTWGGRGEVRLQGGIELEVSRGSVPRLKEQLGLT